jgi:hypothetical protein
MVIFKEAYWKMDKWAAEDADVQNEFYDILDNEETSEKEKIDEMNDFLEVLVWDWDRLESYLYDDEIEDENHRPEYTNLELATYLVNGK